MMASGTLLCCKCKANEKRSSSNNTLLLLQRRCLYFHSKVLLCRLPTPPGSQPALFLGDAAMPGSCFYSQLFCWFHRWEQPSSAAPSHLGAVCGSDGTCRVQRWLHAVLSCSHCCCPEVSSSVDLGGFGELPGPWAMLQGYFFHQHSNSSIDAHRSKGRELVILCSPG